MADATTPERISHYRVIARLGRGAMGEVYRAIDERLGRPVALKLLPGARAENADLQARLLREAQAASALNHPGIVTMHDIGAWRGQVFLVMELVEGDRLSDVAQKGVAVEEALRLVAEAADALGAAHARDILHRDIKSDNLMRTREGRVKVLDFGLAKLRAPVETGLDAVTAPLAKVLDGNALAETLAGSSSDDLAEEDTDLAEEDTAVASHDGTELASDAVAATAVANTPPPVRASSRPAARSQPSPLAQALESGDTQLPSSPGALTPSTLTLAGQLVGTPAYMAPEQTTGGTGDAQSEVFSLGVVLYELLCAQRPFDRPTIQDTLEAVREAPILPPSALAPERQIPPEVDAVVMRALSRDRTRRFTDMKTFAAALRRSRNVSRRMQAVREPRRLLPIVVAAVAVVGAVAGVALLARRPAAAPAVVTSTRRLTFDPGCEEYPSFSSDGHTLIYDGLAEGDYEILALDIDKGTRRRITHQAGWDYGASISPDGKQVAFVHLGDMGRELWLTSAGGDGGTPPRVLGGALSFPVWTPDGEILASPDGERVVRLGGSPLGAARTELAHLPHGSVVRYLAAYNDGHMIAMWQPSLSLTELVLGELAPAEEPHVVEPKLPLDQAAVAIPPTQDGFYYARHGGSSNELLRRPRKGGAAWAVPGGISPTAGFALSSDGKRLAYSSCREANLIARIQPNAAVTPFVPRGDWRDVDAVQVDDQRVIFTSDRGGTNQVWLAELATSSARPLTGPMTDSPALSPDGKMLAYADHAGGGIWVQPLGGGAPSQLTHDGGDVRPRFTHDGKRLLFERTSPQEGSRLWVVEVNGARLHAVTPPGATDGVTNPTRDQIVYLQPTDKGRLIMTTDASGAYHELAFRYLPSGDYASPRISRDGKRMLLVRKSQEVLELSMDARNPAPEVKWRAGIEGVSNADFALDGQGYVASVQMWDGDLWLAEGEFR